MYKQIQSGEKKIGVIGLGYVGLPIALAFAKKTEVIAYDINAERIAMMKQGIDPSNELATEDFKNCNITFTSNHQDLAAASFYIVAVPTPVDSHKVPDLQPLLQATKSIADVLSPEDYVIFESTVYPGCTEEDCIPILESFSGLKNRIDFKTGYSPERINPGDKKHTLKNVVKVVSGCDAASLETIAKVYEMVVEAGVHRASSIKVAEASKVIENTQRDLNIALINELSIVFNRLKINTYEVLEAAGTKWNFLNFSPGLVGGHCIGVDPYYLTYKSEQLGYKPKVILAGRTINDEMPAYVAKNIVQHIVKNGFHLAESNVLVMGTTFKENVSDCSNSKVAELIKELEGYQLKVDAVDPLASSLEMEQEYGISLKTEMGRTYQAVILAVHHKEYTQKEVAYFENLIAKNGLFVDIKGVFRNKMKDSAVQYWSL